MADAGVGDVVPTIPAGGFEVRVLEPRHALVLYVDDDDLGWAMKSEAEAAIRKRTTAPRRSG